MNKLKWNAGNIVQDNDNNFIYTYTHKIITQVVDTENKETINAIEKYCEENDIIPNLIDKDKLELILRLGIQEYNKRYLESKGE